MSQEDLMYVKRMQEDLIRLQMQEDGDSEEIQAKILQSLMTGEGKMDERDRALQLERMMQSMRTNDNSDENIMFQEMLDEHKDRLMSEQYKLQMMMAQQEMK
jgi:hypothetical protein